MRSVYFLAVETLQTTVEPEYYEVFAGKVVTALHSILGTADSIRECVKSTELTSAHTEVDVRDLGASVLAEVLVDLEAPKKVAFDKALFKEKVEQALMCRVKVTKRQVPRDEVDQSSVSTG